MTRFKKYLLCSLEELRDEADERGLSYVALVLDKARAELENSEEGEETE